MPTGFGRVGRVARGAGLEPADEQLVVLAARLEPLAAGVRHLAGRLVHEQAVVGGGQVDPPAAHLAGDAEVVALRVVAEQRQPEPVLAGGRPVALAGVAAGLASAPAARRCGTDSGSASVASLTVDRDRRGHARRTSTVSVAVPSAAGARNALVTVATGLSSVNVGGGGHVAGAAVGELGLDDEPLPVAGAGQLDRRRGDDELRTGSAADGRDAANSEQRRHEQSTTSSVSTSSLGSRGCASSLAAAARVRSTASSARSRRASSGLSGLPSASVLTPPGAFDLEHPAAADAVDDLLPADRAGQFAHQRRRSPGGVVGSTVTWNVDLPVARP